MKAQTVAKTAVGTYADFEDYRSTQRIAVMVRWFLLIAWFLINNYRTDFDYPVIITDILAGGVALANAYLHWRIWRGRPVAASMAMSMSVIDLTMITLGIALTSSFENRLFVLYYPALIGLALVFSSRRVALIGVTAVAAAYSLVSVTIEPTLNYDEGQEKWLLARVMIMYAIVAAANLITRTERELRRAAVESEREQAQRNLELQQQAQRSEIEALETRHRVAREIHDGIAQSMYALNLNLETAADLASQSPGLLSERLNTMVPLAKKTLLETRQYMHNLEPVLTGGDHVDEVIENQAREFETVTRIPVRITKNGAPPESAVEMTSALYRILQESLANVLKHARARRVDIDVVYGSDSLRVAVIDDGTGFDPSIAPDGLGLHNLEERTVELGGTFSVTSAPGYGTAVAFSLPLKGA